MALDFSGLTSNRALDTLRGLRTAREEQSQFKRAQKIRGIEDILAGGGVIDESGAVDGRGDAMRQLGVFDPKSAQSIQDRELEVSVRLARAVKGATNKPLAYKQAITMARKQGIDVSDMPEEWSPQAAQMIQTMSAYGEQQASSLELRKQQLEEDKLTRQIRADDRLTRAESRLAAEESTLPKAVQGLSPVAKKEFQKMQGKDVAEKLISFNTQLSKLPELKETVNILDKLADAATFTLAGQAVDFIVREVGGTATEGAIARTEYEAAVNNQILPLLRDTFGAAFTAAEGESLKKTLGDADKTTEEKQAVLEQFIRQKVNNLKSVGRELKMGEEELSLFDKEKEVGGIKEGTMADNAETGEKIIYRNGQWVAR